MMFSQRFMWIAWPAFLMAGITEMLVFAFVDPSELRWFDGQLDVSRETIYTVTFFIFWIILMVSGSLTTLLSISPFEVNRCPIPNDRRKDDCKNFENSNN